MGTEMASLDNVKKRCVFVELVDGRANAPYEIILEESSTEQSFDNILHSTPILHQNSSRTSFQDYTHSGNLGNVTTSKLLNTISPFDSGLDCDDVSSDNLVISSTSKQLSTITLDSEQGSEHVPSDICACAALEVLPYLIPVRKKKGVIPSHFLYYPQEDSVSLDAVLKETVNRPPFIIQIEDSFHVIVDNPVLVTSNSVSEALLNVFSSYYVFCIEYSKQVLKSLLFLQSKVFGLKDDCSRNCPGLPLFVNTPNAVKL
ncbi:uncharacterized protein LOC116936223 [Daphnia magna]|uniref:uncharacterized protein LOC116936223 n=1 Tax=Daphnia magna TaxID=35525 RepID=UPI001E1BA634|nr:uncharacterized protein LOC116936223 [Daphnia magna]